MWSAALGTPASLDLLSSGLDVNVALILGSAAATLSAGAAIGGILRSRRQARTAQRTLDLYEAELPDLLFEADADGRLLHVSRAAVALLGRPPERMEGRLIHEFISGPVPYVDYRPDSAQTFTPWRAAWRHATEGLVTLEAEVHAVPSGSGASPASIRGVVRRPTEPARTEEQSAALFRTALDVAQNGIMLVDREGRLRHANPALGEMLGYSPTELAQRSLADVVAPGHLDQLSNLVASLVWAAVGQSEYEVQLLARDGRALDAQIAVIVLEEGAHEAGVLIDVRDLTESRHASETIRLITDYDRLTALPNRDLFNRHIERALVDARHDGRSVGLLLLDLDRFKLVNETLGHSSGDRLLKAVAQRLTGRLGPAYAVGRFNGDEFLVLAPDLPSSAAAIAVARQALDALAEPFEHDGHELQVSATIGVAVFPQHASDPETLVRVADLAVHQAKLDGGGQIRMGANDPANPARVRLALEGDLRRAVERREFEIYYQPQFDPLMRIRGMEALLRWRHPQRGIVGPDEFVPLLEETGLIVEVGEWVLRTACTQVQQWRQAGLTDVRLAVNISPRQLLMPNLGGMVEEALRISGLEPAVLELELTETTATLGLDAVLDVLRGLSALGVSTAIDDFGIGHSWLGRLKKFPVSTLKIDRSFVAGLAESPEDVAIIEAIVALGHALGLVVVAEGVETHEQLEIVRRVGCDLIQGFYFSVPLPAAQLEQLLKDCAASGRVAA